MMLALQFKEPNYETLLEKIPRRIYLEWAALYTFQPFGDLRDDLRMAKIVQAWQGGRVADHMLFQE